MEQVKSTEYIFEILAIDKNGQSQITKKNSLLNALIYSENLWKSPKLKDVNGEKLICDEEQDIEAEVHDLDTEGVLTELIESAFILRIKGKAFERIEAFRAPLLQHLKRRLQFSQVRILQDDVSSRIANEIYPLLNKVETQLRRYLVMFFIQKIGVDWWNVTVPRELNERVQSRRHGQHTYSNLVDIDVSLLDFEELGGLIYRQNSGFNRNENIVSRVMKISSLEELDSLKQDLQGNYVKFFKDVFYKHDFENKWKQLVAIRNRVAHNNTLLLEELNIAKTTVADLQTVIMQADSSINAFKFSVDEQEAIRQAAIESLEKYGLRVVGKINLPEEDDRNDYDRNGGGDDDEDAFKIISETELIAELERAEQYAAKKNYKFVGLKVFVTKILGSKGFSYGPTYALINILKERNVIEIYDEEEEGNYYRSKAIRLQRQ